MNSEEIKITYSMRDILAKCGLDQPNRSGFCHCPFHKGDHEPSMKIYEKDFHCFGCGSNGDIFTFLEKFYSISFKDAYVMLGGEYEKNPSYSSRYVIYKAKKEREMKRKRKEQRLRKRKLIYDLIDIYREYVQRSEPLSDVWCDCYNALQLELYHAQVLEEER